MIKKNIFIIGIIIIGIIIIFVLISTLCYLNSFEGRLSDKLGEDGIRKLILSEVPLGTKWNDVVSFLQQNRFSNNKDYQDVWGYDLEKEHGRIDLIVWKWIPLIRDYYIDIDFRFSNDILTDISVGFYYGE